MKPLYIFRHIACDKTGFLCHYLLRRQVPFELICIGPEDRFNGNLAAASGLVFLGAPDSVNNPEPWIGDEIKLIQQAAAMGLPVMGACFGGQLITAALGGQVQADPQMQIGWHPVYTTSQAHAAMPKAQLPASFHVFEWHGESFSLPADAVPLFCDIKGNHQGFLHGKCLAMQFHLEMTEELIDTSLRHFAHCIPPASDSIQSGDHIRDHSHHYLSAMHQVAESIYGWWLEEYVM